MQRAWPLLLIGIGCVLVGACATYPRSGSEALVGTWTNAFATVWIINSNGTFEVDLNHDNRRDAWGTYSVTGDAVTIMGTGGIGPKDCKGRGIYRFTRGRDSLRFGRVHDNCKLRVKN